MKVLWLSPTFNHYKARFLNRLANTDIILTVLTGTGRYEMGDKILEANWNFDEIKVDVPKQYYGRSKVVRDKLNSIFKEYDWIMIPAEKKNMQLFLYAIRLRKYNKNVKLFSYNHPLLKSGNGKRDLLDRMVTKFFFKALDRVIFYTEKSCEWAIKQKLVDEKKAYWANNTIDSAEVDMYLEPRIDALNPPKMLMIGRLVKYRRLNKLFEYFITLKKYYPFIELHVIGDGPEKDSIIKFQKENKGVFYYGALIAEKEISLVMNKIDYVISAGHTGLSINHSFAYKKPYIAFKDYTNHPPEYGYLDNQVNSLILSGNIDADLKILRLYLTNKELYSELVQGVIASKSQLTIDNWVNQIHRSLH